MMNPTEVQVKLTKLNSLYFKQLAIYKSILKLTHEQLSIANAEVQQEVILEKINSRLNLINSLDKFNPEINLLKSKLLSQLNLKEFNISSIKEKLNHPVVSELAEVLKDIGNTLKEINQLDDEFRNRIDLSNQQNIKIPKVNPQTVHNSYKKLMPKDKI